MQIFLDDFADASFLCVIHSSSKLATNFGRHCPHTFVQNLGDFPIFPPKLLCKLYSGRIHVAVKETLHNCNADPLQICYNKSVSLFWCPPKLKTLGIHASFFIIFIFLLTFENSFILLVNSHRSQALKGRSRRENRNSQASSFACRGPGLTCGLC